MENEDWITGNIRLSVGGEPLELQMTVPVKPVKPQRMLPIFQQMTDSFVGIAENSVAVAGGKISCRKGCGACCRQTIPLAEIEAHQIAETVEAFPEPRRRAIKTRFETAWQHFSEIGWFERLDNCTDFSHGEREKVILDYFREGVPCPFLEDEICSIHQVRPLACREYLVTSPAENCAELTAEGVRIVDLPIKPSETVRKITNRKTFNQTVNFVPLVLALEWAARFPDDFPEKTGEHWMADFFTTLTKSEIPKEVRSEK